MWDSLLTWMTGTFLNPAMLGFLGLIPVIILFYILKLKRTAIEIPSTLLWQKSLQDLTANAPFQRLRKNLLLFLQMLILLLIAIALARPYIQALGRSGVSACLLIDRSASMSAREADGRTRLDMAKDRALQMIDQMGGGDTMMIVTFAENSDVLCEKIDDRTRLRAIVRAIQPSQSRTNIRDAVMVAQSLMLAQSDMKLYIVSDGVIRDLAQIGAKMVNTSYVQVGETRDNAGIAAFSIREPFEGQGTRQAFALIHNESDKRLRSTLTLYFNDRAAAIEEIEVAPQADGQFVFALPNDESGLLRLDLDSKDALALDNRAWLTIRPRSAVKTLLVGPGNSTNAVFLKRALSLDPRVELSAVEFADYVVNDEFDLTIFDNVAPEEIPYGASVFINVAPPVSDFELSDETIEQPLIVSQDREHPVMRFLVMENVGIAKARKMTLPEGARALATTTASPLIADLSDPDHQILVIGFDIAESNWPMRLSFPLFMQNLLSWTPRMTAAGGETVNTGRPITIMPEEGLDTVTVKTPDGRSETVKLDPSRPSYFGQTEIAGPYIVQYGEFKEIEHAVNLLDRQESSITPTEALQFGRLIAPAEKDNIMQNKELWPWFLIAALVILALEWYIYSRRAWL